MMRSGVVNSIFASSYSQTISGPTFGNPPPAPVLYTLFKNGTQLATLVIPNGSTNNSQTGLNIPFAFGDYVTVNVQ